MRQQHERCRRQERLQKADHVSPHSLTLMPIDPCQPVPEIGGTVKAGKTPTASSSSFPSSMTGFSFSCVQTCSILALRVTFGLGGYCASRPADQRVFAGTNCNVAELERLCFRNR